MKKILCLLIGLCFFGCQKAAIEKPDNLIDEEVMENIIYDLAVLEAIRTSNTAVLESKGITTPSSYIYEKYDIDSLQFVSSNHYYASDVHNYLKMYKRIEERLASEKTAIDSLIAKQAKPKDPKKLKSPDSIKRKEKILEKFNSKK